MAPRFSPPVSRNFGHPGRPTSPVRLASRRAGVFTQHLARSRVYHQFRCPRKVDAGENLGVRMRRITVLTIAMAMMLALASPASAGRPMEATGVETFQLTPTCSSILGEIPGAPDCRTGNGNTFLTLLNPGTKSGTFEGSQLYEGHVTIFKNGDFTLRGFVTFTGTVEGCGDGTVVFWNEGSGNLATGLTRNHQVATGRGTLNVHANLHLFAVGPDSNEITGSYHC